MRDLLSPRNLVHKQRLMAIEALDREIGDLMADGYEVEADRLLDRRLELMDGLKGPVA